MTLAAADRNIRRVFGWVPETEVLRDEDGHPLLVVVVHVIRGQQAEYMIVPARPWRGVE